jgi:hypothetical protein
VCETRLPSHLGMLDDLAMKGREVFMCLKLPNVEINLMCRAISLGCSFLKLIDR